MENRGKEYQGIVCSLYLSAMLTVLPLYMKDGYWKLGDVKYELFRNITLLCLALCGTADVLGRLDALLHREPNSGGRRIWSWTDSFVMAYAAVNIISFLLSEYKATAWAGYVEWYMGLLTQLLAAAVYFMISRYYNGSHLPIWGGCAAFIVVSLLGLLNRMKVDPLGLFVGLNPGFWDYTHLLSTIGNINWLCGYLCIAVPMVLVLYLRTRSRAGTAVAYAASVLGLLLLCMQGSDIGLVLFGICCGAVLILILFSDQFCLRGIALAAGTGAGFFLMTLCMHLRKAWDTLPTDDKGHELVSWWGWPLLAAGLAVLCYRRIKAPFGESCDKVKRRRVIRGGVLMLGLLVTGGAAAVIFGLSSLDRTWGSGRGALWILAVRGFEQGDILLKLFGAGPDCFAEYIYGLYNVSRFQFQKGHWENTIFTNAHNEWLTLLVNTGIAGAAAYGGILVSALARYGRRIGRDSYFLLGVLVLLLYGANSLVSFQQVLNMPLLFLVLGLCENRLRSNHLTE